MTASFRFTQRSLQDFLDCKRRYQLRYLLKLPWPSHIIEPAEIFEQHIRQGEQFHRLVHQHIMGMPPEALDRLAAEPPLNRWWEDFLETGFTDTHEIRLPEITRSTSLAGFELAGKFDLVAVDEQSNILIVDWKTSRVVPGRNDLRKRMQSRVYPYILAREGIGRQKDEKVEPDRIRMRYWFTQAPREPIEFIYNSEQFKDDGEFLAALIQDIVNTNETSFPLTEKEELCRYCPYRSLCDRGAEAGQWETFDQDVDELSEWLEATDLDQLSQESF